MRKSLPLVAILIFTVSVLVFLPSLGTKTARAASFGSLLKFQEGIPEAKRCVDMNFESTGIVRVGINADRADLINCRVIVQNGSYFSYLGAALTSPAEIGSDWLLSRGVVQAIEIFSPTGLTTFENGDVFCLKGTGQLYFLSAATTPRQVLQAPVYRVPDFSGYVCTTLFGPGTLVMTQDHAVLPPLPPTPTTLTNCTLTVNYSVRMHVEANTTSTLITIIPYTTVLQATGKITAWYRVSYQGTTGWIRSRYESAQGDC